VDADLCERHVDPEGADALGFRRRRLTASIALRVNLQTPGGLPWGLSSRPSTPSRTHLLTAACVVLDPQRNCFA
jgi:hypothetical protein